MGFGNLGVSELLVLAVLVLVFFGPRRIPEVARSLGEALRTFRRGMNEIRRELEDVERSLSDDGPRTRRRPGDGERWGGRDGDGRRPGETPGAWDGDAADGVDRDAGSPDPAAPSRGRVEPGSWDDESRGTSPEDTDAAGSPETGAGDGGEGGAADRDGRDDVPAEEEASSGGDAALSGEEEAPGSGDAAPGEEGAPGVPPRRPGEPTDEGEGDASG